VVCRINTRSVLIFCVVFLMAGCATGKGDANHNDTTACAFSDSRFSRNGTPGIQFANQCNHCMAVAFEYRNPGATSQWSACYVPPQTRVVFWDAKEYWLITHKPCEEAKKFGLGGISTAEIEHNDRIGRCGILGALSP